MAKNFRLRDRSPFFSRLFCNLGRLDTFGAPLGNGPRFAHSGRKTVVDFNQSDRSCGRCSWGKAVVSAECRPDAAHALSARVRGFYARRSAFDPLTLLADMQAVRFTSTFIPKAPLVRLIWGFPNQAEPDSSWRGRVRAMPSTVKLQGDYSARSASGIARRSKNVNQSRRFLSPG